MDRGAVADPTMDASSFRSSPRTDDRDASVWGGERNEGSPCQRKKSPNEQHAYTPTLVSDGQILAVHPSGVVYDLQDIFESTEKRAYTEQTCLLPYHAHDNMKKNKSRRRRFSDVGVVTPLPFSGDESLEKTMNPDSLRFDIAKRTVLLEALLYLHGLEEEFVARGFFVDSSNNGPAPCQKIPARGQHQTVDRRRRNHAPYYGLSPPARRPPRNKRTILTRNFLSNEEDQQRSILKKNSEKDTRQHLQKCTVSFVLHAATWRERDLAVSSFALPEEDPVLHLTEAMDARKRSRYRREMKKMRSGFRVSVADLKKMPPTKTRVHSIRHWIRDGIGIENGRPVPPRARCDGFARDGRPAKGPTAKVWRILHGNQETSALREASGLSPTREKKTGRAVWWGGDNRVRVEVIKAGLPDQKGGFGEKRPGQPRSAGQRRRSRRKVLFRWTAAAESEEEEESSAEDSTAMIEATATVEAIANGARPRLAISSRPEEEENHKQGGW